MSKKFVCIETTEEFWDCECGPEVGLGYIHSIAMERCPNCGTAQEGQPDSRVKEVTLALRAYLINIELMDLNCVGGPVLGIEFHNGVYVRSGPDGFEVSGLGEHISDMPNQFVTDDQVRLSEIIAKIRPEEFEAEGGSYSELMDFIIPELM